MVNKTLQVVWVRQGEVNWELPWVRIFGYKRFRKPEFEDHIGFANFDLKRAGFPIIVEKGDVLEIPNVSPGQIESVKSIISFHGFEISGIK